LTISKDEAERIKREAQLEAVERALMRGADPEDVAYEQDLPLYKVLEIKEKLT